MSALNTTAEGVASSRQVLENGSRTNAQLLATPSLEWDEQVRLIDRCIRSQTPLHEELRDRGLTYDALRYERNGPVKEARRVLKTLDQVKKPACGLQVVSFFSGSGGMDLGLEAAGFEHVALIENNATFCETLRLNRPDWTVIGPPTFSGDISRREELAEELKRLTGPAFDGLFVGGPPCRPFSIAANQRFAKWGENFKRVGFANQVEGNLLFDFIWFIDKFSPSAFLIENVPGLATVDGGGQLGAAIRHLESRGYAVSAPRILEASDYGVPQMRSRLFLVGSRKYSFLFPEPGYETVPCVEALDRPMNGLTNHQTRQHDAASVKRYMVLDYGRRDDLGRVDRLDPNKPSKTVIAGGTKGGGRSHLHPFVPRTLSVRECARLQTFPDNYTFAGSSARQFTQVGNAVPPLLAFRLATLLRKQLFQ